MAVTEIVTWSCPSDLPEIETMFAENSERPWSVFHETYTICTIGISAKTDRADYPHAAEWIYRGKSHYSPPLSLMLVEPGELHRNTKTPPPDPFSVLFIHSKLVNEVASEAGMWPEPHFTKAATTDPKLHRLLSRFHLALSKQTTLLHRQSLLVNCIQELLAKYCEQNPDPVGTPGRRRLEWARSFLVEHVRENITLTQLAKISGLSQYHLLRAFSQEFGMPPHRYLTFVRIEKARQLLKS